MVALGYFVLPALDMPAFTLSGSWLPYIVLSSAVSLAALGYGLLISVVARTTEHAVVLGGGGIIIMAAIGGIMVPVYVDARNHANYFTIFAYGLGIKWFPKFIIKSLSP